MTKVCIIVAVSENGVIGKDNQLPWHFPEDLKRFKELTQGEPVVMGRNTWDSLPRKPLPGRTNIVVSSSGKMDGQDVFVAGSLDLALIVAKQQAKERIWIIGGKRMYEEALKHSDELYITRIKGHYEGDTILDIKPCGQTWELETCELVVTQSEKNPGLRAYFEKWVLQ